MAAMADQNCKTTLFLTQCAVSTLAKRVNTRLLKYYASREIETGRMRGPHSMGISTRNVWTRVPFPASRLLGP